MLICNFVEEDILRYNIWSNESFFELDETLGWLLTILRITILVCFLFVSIYTNKIRFIHIQEYTYCEFIDIEKWLQRETRNPSGYNRMND